MINGLKESPSAHHPVQVNSISNQRSTRFHLCSSINSQFKNHFNNQSIINIKAI
ncbi:hypothetical protein KFK09_016960 [Dendrobium nobile]|uniref:Uncharacterized protein n=1 Tax=Dendrobium nobile TaxID=94219 RepID=A0A8T3B664_DENNO|nr:hypothetical protein KFK09_016960 [Dendrobium nobile]